MVARACNGPSALFEDCRNPSTMLLVKTLRGRSSRAKSEEMAIMSPSRTGAPFG